MQYKVPKIKWIKSSDKEMGFIGLIRQKRAVVFAQLCVIGAISAILQGGYDLYAGFPLVMAIDVFVAIILLLGFYINYIGNFRFARILIFSCINIILFVFASVVPEEVGIYLIYFPLIIFYFISFDYKGRIYSFGFTTLSVILNAILLITNYQPFGEINLQPSDPTSSFIINLFTSFLLVGLGINFLIKMNHHGEKLLLEQQEKSKTLSVEVNEKNLSLEKTNLELDRFVYSTSHDLKAPLASIKGLLNLADLEKEPIPPSISTYLTMIKERVNSLDLFIRDILDYSRNSRQDVMVDTVNISKLIDEVFLTNKYLENTNKVELKTEVDATLTLQIDKNRLFRVLVNLVSNAIKYSDLDNEMPYVSVKAIVESNKLILTVKDNGIGIDKESNEKVFDMFYRGTELADGSGLGLYIAREMIHKMNGSLEFESDLGKGSTFSVRIPIT